MATSGTYAFNPSLGELTLYAFNLCEVRNTAIAQEHMESARMASNMVLSNWSNRGVNLWCVDLITEPLVEGQSVYTVDQNTVMVLDAYVQIDNGDGNPIDYRRRNRHARHAQALPHRPGGLRDHRRGQHARRTDPLRRHPAPWRGRRIQCTGQQLAPEPVRRPERSSALRRGRGGAHQWRRRGALTAP